MRGSVSASNYRAATIRERILPLFACLFVFATLQFAQEVGSSACKECHAAIYDSYSKRPMAQSSGAVGAGTKLERFENNRFTAYRVDARDGQVAFTFENGDIRVERKLDYYIGSGAVGRSYLSLIDGFMFQAPVAWYTAPARWNLSPGFENSADINLTRAVQPACLKCHSSRIQHAEGTVNGYKNPPFLEGGVSCERCHGPGSDHIAAMQSGQKGAAISIVNPVKLDADRRGSVCAQCHLSGAAEISRSENTRAFRAGDRLSDFVTVLIPAAATGAMPVISHYQKMTESACWQASREKMWCGTCHDPHRVPARATEASYFRSRCLTCHSDSSCPAPRPSRAKAADTCTRCHMPASGAPTVQHAVFTDHSIPRKPRSEAPLTQTKVIELIPFIGFTATDRELGLAYADLGLKDNNPVWGRRAFELLKKVNEDNPGDLKVASQLAQLYDRMRNERKACELYASIVAGDPAAIAPAVNLGTCEAKQGRMTEAMRLWKSVLTRSPGLESARLNLAVAQGRAGDVAAARATITEGLRHNPASRRAREILQQLGQPSN